MRTTILREGEAWYFRREDDYQLSGPYDIEEALVAQEEYYERYLDYGPKRSVIAITGGRYAEDGKPLIPSDHQLTCFFALYQGLGCPIIVHGAAIGTDRAVARALVDRFHPFVPPIAYPYDSRIGIDLSPHHRNRRMLRDSKAAALVAFPGGGGTANCVSEALAMGLDLWEWRGDRETGHFVHKQEEIRQ